MRLFFYKLHSLLSSFGEGDLVVLNDEADHFGHQLEVGDRRELLHAVQILLALLYLAQLLDCITGVFVFGRGKEKDLVGDGVDAGYLFDKLVIVFGGKLHSFLMLFDQHVALLQRLLVPQLPLLVLPNYILRVAFQHLDLYLYLSLLF